MHILPKYLETCFICSNIFDDLKLKCLLPLFPFDFTETVNLPLTLTRERVTRYLSL